MRSKQKSEVKWYRHDVIFLTRVCACFEFNRSERWIQLIGIRIATMTELIRFSFLIKKRLQRSTAPDSHKIIIKAIGCTEQKKSPDEGNE